MMDYKDYMIVENWKDVSTEDLKISKKSAKKLSVMNTEWVMFYAFLMIFIAAPATVLITRGFGRDFHFFVGMFIAYSLVWKFYLKKKMINKGVKQLADEAVKEIDIVMKYRTQ